MGLVTYFQGLSLHIPLNHNNNITGNGRGSRTWRSVANARKNTQIPIVVLYVMVNTVFHIVNRRNTSVSILLDLISVHLAQKIGV